jgi:hypothetical protein
VSEKFSAFSAVNTLLEQGFYERIGVESCPSATRMADKSGLPATAGRRVGYCIRLFAQADEFDGDIQLVLYRNNNSATGRAV